jgi:hypothetical protein
MQLAQKKLMRLREIVGNVTGQRMTTKTHAIAPALPLL